MSEVEESHLLKKAYDKGEEFNRAAPRSIGVTIAVIAKDGTILAINEAWERFGRENGNAALARSGVGGNYLAICREAAAASREAREALTGIEAVLDRSVAEFILEYPCHSPTEKRWFLLYASPLLTEQGGAILSHVNITEHKRVEEALRRQRQVAESLQEIAMILTSSLDQTTVLSTIFRELGRVIRYDGAAIFLQEGDVLVLSDAAGHRKRNIGKRIPLSSNHLVVQVFKARHPRIIADTTADPGWVPLEEAERFHSWIGAPLVASGVAIGLLSVVNFAVAAYEPQDAQILQSFANHTAVAITNARLYRLAQQAAVNEERQRLARELHDSITQLLYSITLMTKGWQTMAKGGRLSDVVGCFERLHSLGQQALKETRLLIHQLRPPLLAQLGLVGALQHRLELVEQRADVEAVLEVSGSLKLAPEVEEQLFHIAQEALNNSLRYAQATAIKVKIIARDRHLLLCVYDNGVGFDAATASRGLGLAGMQERAALIGGHVVIRSKPGKGTKVEVNASNIRPGGRPDQ